MPKKIVFSEEQIKELKTLMDNHVPQLQIAKHFHVTDDTIRKICRENNLEINMPHKCTCIICGDTFYSNIKGAKTCKKEHHRICEVCGKDFIVDRADIKTTCKGECASLKKYGSKHPASSKIVVYKRTATLKERYLDPSEVQKLREKQEKACLEKYGAKSWAGSEIGRKQTRETNLRKYGFEEPFGDPVTRAKCDKVNEERYGCKYPTRTEAIKEKTKQTCLRKYGVENPMQSKEILDRFKSNYKAKTGYDYPMCNPEVKQKLSDTCVKNFGVSWACMRKEARNYNSRSKLNQSFESIANGFGLQLEPEFPLSDFSFDFKYNNTLIELNPSITHNSHMSMFRGVDPKDRFYHQNKTKVAEEAGYRCIHIFDWDSWEAMIQLILPKENVYARKCHVMKIDKNTAEIFTQRNHLQGSCRGQNIVYGLFYKGELVQLMSFGTPRYNKHYDLELLRLCTRADLNVVGGASKLFSQFKKDYPDKSVISYCDYSKFTGKVYEQMGMKLDKITEPAKVWSKEDKHITDNLLRQRGYDQLFGTAYGKGTSNEQLMLDNGWLPVYDCGQKVFVFKN